MPLFSPPLPQSWALSLGDPVSGGFSTLTAGAIYFVGVYVPASCVITAFRCQFSGVPTGNVDMGIYDSSNNLLTHMGATAATTGVQTLTLATPYSLTTPGKYWLAWMDTVADSIWRASTVASFEITQRSQATTNTQLVTAPAMQTVTARPMIFALLQGGFS